MSCFFDQIDAVYVINLDFRTDRWNSFQELWSEIIPPQKIKKISAVLGTDIPGYGQSPWFRESTGDRSRSWAGMAGCALSHQKVIKDAHENGFKNILILEDDAVPSKLMTDSLNGSLLSDFMSTVHNWGLFYLGCSTTPSYGRIAMQNNDHSVGIWQFSGVLTTHAYVVNERSYDTLLTHLPNEKNVWSWIARYRAIDTWFRDYYCSVSDLSIYAVIPRLILQGEFASDIVPHHGTSGQVSVVYKQPKSLGSFSYKLLSLSLMPFRVLKRKLNSLKTYQRAQKNGFPGFRKKRK